MTPDAKFVVDREGPRAESCLLAYELRKAGKSWRAIGAELGQCGEIARQKAHRGQHIAEMRARDDVILLPCRLVNVLDMLGVSTPRELAALNPNKGFLLAQDRLGKKSFEKLQAIMTECGMPIRET